MSLREMFRINLKSLQISSRLNMLPIEFTERGASKVCENSYRRIAFYALLANSILYTSYLSVRFVEVVTAENISILHFAPHALLLSIAAISLFWYANLFFWMEAPTNMIFNELLDIITNSK